MINDPLVSAIVITYNRKKLLKETIDSILNQTYENFELIVVDNFSDYDFFTHMDCLNDKRIRPFQNANNGVIAVNRNFGIEKAKGKYITFCDDDDIWLHEKLEKQVSLMERRNEVGLSYVLFSIITENGSITGEFPKPKNRYRGNIFRSLYFKPVIANSGIMMRKDLISSVGMLNEDFDLIATEDYDFLLRAALETEIDYVESKPLLLWRRGANSMSRGLIKQWKRSLFMRRKFKNRVDNWLYFITVLHHSIYFLIIYIKSIKHRYN